MGVSKYKQKKQFGFMHEIKQYFLPQNKFFKDKYFLGITITSLCHWDGNGHLYLFQCNLGLMFPDPQIFNLVSLI